MPGRAFRPGSSSTVREQAVSTVKPLSQNALHKQFRPAPTVRKPSYEELQARNSYRGYQAPQYGSYQPNVAVPAIRYGSPWSGW
jgi:hypothetical protein